jgi:iron complex transport system substrate-binding protein
MTMKRFVAVAVLAAATLGACGSSGKTTATGSTTTATAPPVTSFPVAVTAANGTVTIPARPTRILSLSATATQMLYAIGAGPQVVGVDVYSTDPPDAPRTKFTGSETSAEDYVSEHPDLVLLAFDTGGKLVAQLSTLHIPTLLLPPAKAIDDSYSQFRQLGLATGHFAEAVKEANTVAQQLDSVARSVGNRAKGLTYYHEVDNTLYTATSKTFIGALYGRLGMVNVADAADSSGSGYPQLSAEYLVRQDPDFVFLGDTVCCHETAATFGGRPGFSQLKAVRLGHVVLVSDPIASEWGPRVVDFLKVVAAAVEHPSATTTTT